MIRFSIEIKKKVIKDGKPSFVKQKKEISVRVKPEEILFRDWIDFQIKRVKMPSYLQSLETVKLGEVEAQIETWTKAQWAQYLFHIGEVVTIFSDANLNDFLLATPNKVQAGSSGLMVIYSMIMESLNNYEPKRIEFFEFKGEKYYLPKDFVQKIGLTEFRIVGSDMQLIEAIEALQTEEILSGKDEEGNYHFGEDAKFHSDILIVACIARRVLSSGELEEMPSNHEKRQSWIQDRYELFKDLPMNIVLDIDFFLQSSKLAYNNTLQLALSSKALLAISNRQKRPKKARRSGRNGAGN